MKTKEQDFEIQFFEKLVQDKPDFVDALIPLAEAYTRKGLYDKGLRVDMALSRLCKDDPTVHYNLACSYALTGQKKKALASLKSAVRLGYRDMKHLKSDPDLKCLHDETEFKKIISAL